MTNKQQNILQSQRKDVPLSPEDKDRYADKEKAKFFYDMAKLTYSFIVVGILASLLKGDFLNAPIMLVALTAGGMGILGLTFYDWADEYNRGSRTNKHAS